MTDQTTQMIQSTIDENSVVLFMKGSKEMPQCGFSSAVVNALAYLEVDFKDVNVLEDGELRDGIKEEYFDSDSHKWIVGQIMSYHDKYHTTVSMDVLKVELQKIENDILQVAVKEELRNSYQASQEDMEYVEEEFSTFCKNQELKDALLEGA